MKGKSLKDNG